MEIQSIKIKYVDVVKDWISDLKDVDRKRKNILAANSKKGQPIIIDYGSDTIKAGYISSVYPQLIFKPLVSKTKESTTSFSNTINFTYDQLDLLKNNYRTPFERNIIQHFSIFQHCNDFLFSELVLSEQTIKNPLIITQAAANPVYCRHNMIELFFECYGVNEIFMGIDGLFAYFHEIGYNMHDYKRQSRLIINFGANSTHIIPIIKGKVDFDSIKRLNFGSYNSFELTGKIITLKNPELKNYLTYPFLKHIYTKFTRVSLDYKKQLNYFKQGKLVQNSKFYKNKIEQQNKNFPQSECFPPIQIEFEKPGYEVSLQQLKRRQQIRKRMSQRLREAIQKKKAQKIKIYQSDYQQLLKIRQKYKQDPQNMKQQLINIFGQSKPVQIMNRKIKQLQIKLQMQPKDQEEKKFALLDIPDNQIPPQKQRLKKLQQYQKAAYENRKKKQQQQEEEQKKMRQLRQQNPQKYMQELKQRYKILADKMKESERIKNQLSNRNSRLNQKRMQTLAQLAQQNEQQDNFGQNDEDWLVYKGYQQSDHRSQIQAIEVQLRQIDPDWMQNSDKHHLNTGYNLYLGSQLIRGPQIYFQPSAIGNDQANISDTVHIILKHYTKQIQKQLLMSILLTGGGCGLAGLKQRLHKQIISNFESGWNVDIKIAKQQKLGAYYGMKGLVTKYPQYIRQNSIKKGEYFLGNLFSRVHEFGKIDF